MASFRRSLSPAINERAVPNGSVIPLSPTHTSNLTLFGVDLAASVSTTITLCDSLSSYGALLCCPLSWFRISQRQGVYERSKFKGHVWKKPFLHIILCFFLGLLLGLTPFSWPNVSTSTHEVRQEFALELKGFPTYLQQEIVSHDGRERQLEVVRPGNPAARGVDSGRDAENHRSGFPTFSRQDPDSYAQFQVTDSGSRKLLIVITPTYNRPFQALYLTRLSHTLKLVPPPLLWLVVEMHGQTMETAGILRRTGLMYRHLVCDKNATLVKDRGVHQRNVALAHIEQHQLDGVVYFADDDNVYTLELFEQMRKIKRFGTWPVGMLVHSKSKAILEGPVCDGEKVIGWHTNEKSKRLRRFHVDMCGFGFNSTILWDPHRWQKLTPEPIRQLDNVKEGFQETTFIEQLVEDESQMEGFPDGCSKVLVWHLHLEAPGLVYPSGWSLHDNLNATISFPGKS